MSNGHLGRSDLFPFLDSLQRDRDAGLANVMDGIAEGLTNKEVANPFCLSEQTVKNRLYRMKHKIGADDRLGIVQVCRTQWFMP